MHRLATLQQQLARAQQAQPAYGIGGGGGGGAGGSGGGGGAASARARDSVIPMDALGEPYQRLARHDRLGGTVQAAARLLDSTAASASHLIRHHPLARLGVFAYLLLIHLLVYVLIYRLQHHAMAVHIAAAAGLPGAGLPGGGGGGGGAAGAGGAAAAAGQGAGAAAGGHPGLSLP
ncbi:hypothetical protein MNEG_7160 [Monoraphidium neglectum]|uniref:Protein CASP n=1 Tax=Monoraphidium neglectum TaxID=145388 RepID=A0A0D2L041_9CHLO|nr:hypothetical protein MNEG_7160 [Monoraphidium neglectum]KIZ00799.1 hypothetical protein MNEG_7160 [Monoraphidium neglectum]|eukprot:XP_013899818.1 hypothetical protein MNEG_7160 [Monoraphidium neglectum]